MGVRSADSQKEAKKATGAKVKKNKHNSGFNHLMTSLVDMNNDALETAFYQAKQMASQIEVKTDRSGVN